jgi:hypothetical protein
LLEIANPAEVAAYDLRVLKEINAGLLEHTDDLSIETVAGTIFPQQLYLLHGRADLYSAYQRVIKRAKKCGTWGTYFDRMTNRIDSGGNPVNPLDHIIDKLRRSIQPGARTIQSAYELCASDPVMDLYDEVEMGCELSTYEPCHDRKYPRGGPCLSHVSFKISDRSRLDLTAMYRSHYYCSRALGNLVGLGRLQSFVAKEAGLKVGALTCLSTHAEMDWKAWGEKAAGKALLARA